ncbi:hypothetical protein D1871_12770 [Nakamurella silvestris]|nr:hypothetical protein D1871_12770 [Nakamurella silvestris]
MTTIGRHVAPAPVDSTEQTATFPRLLATELHRMFLRRFTKVLLGLSALGFLVTIGYLWSSYQKVTPEHLAQATASRDMMFADQQQWHDSCLAENNNSVDMCGTGPELDWFPVNQFLPVTPFDPTMIADYTMAVGVAVALAGFVLGATTIGAEWSSKNIVAWLFFEPRRLRLMGAKLAVLLAVLLILAVIAQLIWLVTAKLLLAYRGIGVADLDPPIPDFWPHALQVQLRAALLVIPAGLLGFGLANMIRNTAAAFGIAFGYFVVVEAVLSWLSPGLQRFQFTTGLIAWVHEGGITVSGDDVYQPEYQGFFPEQIHISNAHGGWVILGYAAVIAAVSMWMFRRRDIT